MSGTAAAGRASPQHPSMGIHDMRHSTLSAALAVRARFGQLPASAADTRDQQLAELKAQLALLQAKVAELRRARTRSPTSTSPPGKPDKIATTQPVVDTKGGIKITSADKKFEASIGGRLHFDAYAFDRDIAATTGTTEFRRAPDPAGQGLWLGLQGRAGFRRRHQPRRHARRSSPSRRWAASSPSATSSRTARWKS